jgi:DNA topoisomerase I
MTPRAQSSEFLSTDPLASALAAGLRYVNGNRPGVRRVRCGTGFRYIGPDGAAIRDPDELQRIRSLVIPPAWQNVWICSTRFGHIQAIGWDARGRKQYRYHSLYREVRDQAKFSRMIAFGTVLAVIRQRVKEDLKRPGLPREKVLAAVVRLLETTHIRVGNAEYAKENESFGLTTLRNRHVQISQTTLHFEFKGKSGQWHLVEMTDRRLARIVRECQELPGYELFQYVDESGQRRAVDSADVNAYIREIAGAEFTAKDFRTWAGTVLAARELAAAGPCRNPTDGKRKMVAAIKSVARHLGNRPATCRKYYIHPAIFDAFSDRSLFTALSHGAEQEQAYNGKGLLAEEYAVMVIVAQYLENLAKAASASKNGHGRRRQRYGASARAAA